MQEEVTQKTVALVFKASRLSADVLRKAMRLYLENHRHRQQGRHGKIPVRKLVGMDAGAKIIDVNCKDIKAFERVARKYSVDFAVKKDTAGAPPRYLVFFKGRDADVITQAFKEFVKANEKRQGRVSVKEKLAHFREQPGRDQNRDEGRTNERQFVREHKKDRGQSL